MPRSRYSIQKLAFKVILNIDFNLFGSEPLTRKAFGPCLECVPGPVFCIQPQQQQTLSFVSVKKPPLTGLTLAPLLWQHGTMQVLKQYTKKYPDP